MATPRLFLSPVVKEAICQNLNFEDIVNLRDAFKLSSLKCPVTIFDPNSSKEITLPGVNPTTITIAELVGDYGLNLALIKAAKKGWNLVVQTLINAGTNVNEVNQYGETALILASARGRYFVVQTLIRAGADVEAASNHGSTALIWASLNGHNSTVQTLIAAGANVNAVDRNKQTALMMASKNGHHSVIQTLIAAKANVNAVNQFGDTASTLASGKGYSQIVKYLKNMGHINFQ